MASGRNFLCACIAVTITGCGGPARRPKPVVYRCATESTAGCHGQLACPCPCKALSVDALADKPPVAPIGTAGRCRQDGHGPVVYDHIYTRVNTVFAQARYDKPRDRAPTSRADELPPLILQSVITSAGAAPPGGRFGAVRLDDRGRAFVDTARPTIYTDSGRALLNGRDYEQVVHVWWSPAADAAPRWLGVRTTLGRDGFPAIWEVIGSDTNVALIFVSESLERASATAVGAPLPGRRFSIERSLRDRPEVVVPRILADGPVPMGPWVYLTEDGRSVTTLLCRCMSSQVEEIVETDYYDALPLSGLAGIPLGPSGRARPLPGEAASLDFAIPAQADPRWLEQALRLPPDL
ncbi:MAG: hypothetical protein ACE5F9_04965 [Phycisphaerae bacterium]